MLITPNIFGYSFGLFLAFQIYLDIHSYYFEPPTYIWIFIYAQNKIFGIHWAWALAACLGWGLGSMESTVSYKLTQFHQTFYHVSDD